MSTAEILRQLQIKTKALDRLHKELQYYIKEKEKEHARVERMKAENADPHDLKQAENVLAESAMMIPETRQRCEAALRDLKAYADDNSIDAEGTEELAAANEKCAEVEALL